MLNAIAIQTMHVPVYHIINATIRISSSYGEYRGRFFTQQTHGSRSLCFGRTHKFCGFWRMDKHWLETVRRSFMLPSSIRHNLIKYDKIINSTKSWLHLMISVYNCVLFTFRKESVSRWGNRVDEVPTQAVMLAGWCLYSCGICQICYHISYLNCGIPNSVGWNLIKFFLLFSLWFCNIKKTSE